MVFVLAGDHARAWTVASLVRVVSSAHGVDRSGFARMDLTSDENGNPFALMSSYFVSSWSQGIISFALIYGIISILQFAVAAVLLLVHFLLCCTASIGVIWQTDFRTHCRLLVRGVARHAQQLWAQFWPLLILLSFVKTGTAYWPVVVFLWAYLACCWAVAIVATFGHDTELVVITSRTATSTTSNSTSTSVDASVSSAVKAAEPVAAGSDGPSAASESDVAPEANRKARKALRRAARTERAARAKPVAPVTDEPATATTRDTAADATKTTDAPRRAARAEPVAAASDKPATASTTTTESKPESKTAAKKRRRAEAAAAVQADIQTHGTWQPVQPNNPRHSKVAAQAAPTLTTKGHPAPALKERRAPQDKLSITKAARGITAVQPTHGSQPDCIQTKPESKRSWNSIFSGPTTPAAASAATVNTKEWPALGDA